MGNFAPSSPPDPSASCRRRSYGPPYDPFPRNPTPNASAKLSKPGDRIKWTTTTTTTTTASRLLKQAVNPQSPFPAAHVPAGSASFDGSGSRGPSRSKKKRREPGKARSRFAARTSPAAPVLLLLRLPASL